MNDRQAADGRAQLVLCRTWWLPAILSDKDAADIATRKEISTSDAASGDAASISPIG